MLIKTQKEMESLKAGDNLSKLDAPSISKVFFFPNATQDKVAYSFGACVHREYFIASLHPFLMAL